MIVIDASALLELILGTSRAEHLSRRAFDPAERLHAPHLLDVEVIQVLRRLVQRKDLTTARAEQALDDFSSIAIERHDHQPLMGRIWQLRENLSAYDAAYASLAEALSAPLLTCDSGFTSAPGIRAKIEYVSA